MVVAAAAILIIFGLVLRYLFVWSPLDASDFFSIQPLIIAHRGLLHQAPENTLSAYKEAVNSNLPAIEIDVIMTRDGKLVCSHNFDLERETDGAGFIDEMDYEDLRAVTAGIRTHPDKPEVLPLLEEAVTAIPDTVRLDIEIKARGLADIRTAMKVARMCKTKKIPHKAIISSFNPLAIWAVKWVDPTIITGFILETMDYFGFTNWIHPDCIHPAAELVTPDLLKYARDRGMRVNVWTVNTKLAADWLLNRGIDGIITDRPEYLGDLTPKSGGVFSKEAGSPSRILNNRRKRD